MPRFDAIGMIVTDMAATIAFYEMLGLSFPDGAASEGHVEAMNSGGVRLMFDTVEMVQSFSTHEPPAGGHRVAVAFLCDSPTEVDELCARLGEAGHHVALEPFDAFWGQRYATVHDPNGNPVDLFAPLEP